MKRAVEASPIPWQNAIAAMSCLKCEAVIKEETWPGDKTTDVCGNTAWKISEECKSTTRPQWEVITLPSLVISMLQLEEAKRMHNGKEDNSLYMKAGQRPLAHCSLSVLAINIVHYCIDPNEFTLKDGQNYSLGADSTESIVWFTTTTWVHLKHSFYWCTNPKHAASCLALKQLGPSS